MMNIGYGFLKFANMLNLSICQRSTLERLMNMRLKLTRVQQNPSKYDPPVTFKEHYLSHLPEDVRN